MPLQMGSFLEASVTICAWKRSDVSMYGIDMTTVEVVDELGPQGKVDKSIRIRLNRGGRERELT